MIVLSYFPQYRFFCENYQHRLTVRVLAFKFKPPFIILGVHVCREMEWTVVNFNDSFHAATQDYYPSGFVFHNASDLKGTTAAAGLLHVRVLKLEAAGLKSLKVVNGNALQIHRAHLIHRDGQTVHILNDVVFFGLGSKFHGVLEPAAYTATHSNTE